MAIHEHDREDLLREGRGMPWRGQCFISDENVVVGFRQQGQASLLCGVDPVFQFNSLRQLRRAFFKGTRYRAESGRLIALVRTSRGGRVEFASSPIDPATADQLTDALRSWVGRIRIAVAAESWQVEGETAEEFKRRLADWLEELDESVPIATRPDVGDG